MLGLELTDRQNYFILFVEIVRLYFDIDALNILATF